MSVARSRCAEGIAAAWALVRWALFDAPEPSAEQRRRVAGPTILDTAGLDPDLATEQISEAFLKMLPTGGCGFQVWHECTVRTDDVDVAHVKWQWPPDEHARVQRVTLTFKSRPETERRATQRALAVPYCARVWITPCLQDRIRTSCPDPKATQLFLVHRGETLTSWQSEIQRGDAKAFDVHGNVFDGPPDAPTGRWWDLNVAVSLSWASGEEKPTLIGWTR